MVKTFDEMRQAAEAVKRLAKMMKGGAMDKIDELQGKMIRLRFICYDKVAKEFQEEVVITEKELVVKVMKEYLKKGCWRVVPRPDLKCPECQSGEHVEEWGPQRVCGGVIMLVKCTACNYAWDAWGIVTKEDSRKEREKNERNR